jgi:LysM repeat protein
MKSKKLSSKKLLWSLVFLSVFNFAQAQNQKQDPVVLQYIETFKQIAMDEQLRSGIPASITLAQGIHETSAGQSELVRKSNNHFGIKCKTTWTGQKVYHTDDAVGECFRKYDEAAESYRDHSDFLKANQRYAFLFAYEMNDYASWAKGLKQAGYATNPQYPKLLIDLVEKYELNHFTELAANNFGKASAKQHDQIIDSKMRVQESEADSVIVAPSEMQSIPKPIEYPKARANYPTTGVFQINRTKVIYAEAGTSLLAIANEQQVSISSLYDFNEMPKGIQILNEAQLIFVQLKRKVSDQPMHQVEQGETLQSIAQTEGIRLESLLAYNQLSKNSVLVAGTQLKMVPTK